MIAHAGQGSDSLAALKAYEADRAPATARVVQTNRTVPPDIVNLRVEELVGDRPFDDLGRYISQAELRAYSENYQAIAGFSHKDLAGSEALGAQK